MRGQSAQAAKPGSGPGVAKVTAPLAFVPAAHASGGTGVDYTANGPSYAVALSSRFAELAMASRTEAGRKTASPEQTEFIRMSLVGAGTAVPFPQDALGAHANIFQGKDPAKWRPDVPTYGRVLYRGAYPGVDLAYYGTQGRLEYDFLVSPKAAPSAIRLRFQGASMKLGPEGSLRLTTPQGREMRFEKPVVYQRSADGSRSEVAGSYTLAKNGAVGFRVGAYDHSRELVIDPVLSYASFLGGNELDYIYSSAVSPQGYLYVTGSTYYYDTTDPVVIYPTTKGAYQTTCNWCLHGQSTVVVTKFSANGSSLLYSTFLEGNYYSNQAGGGAGYSIAASVDDEAYVFGITFDADFPLVKPIQSLCRNESNTTTCPGSFFITRLNSAGNALLYSTFFGYNSGGFVANIALDASKNIVLSGSAYAPGGTADLPITENAYEPAFPPTDQAVPFVSEISANGAAYVYSTWLGGSMFCDEGNGTCQAYPGQAALSNGLIYVTGSTEAGDFPVTSNAFQRSCNLNNSGGQQCNEMNGYLAIFNSTAATGPASAKTVTYIHGPTSGQDVYLQAVAVDPSGNIFLTGDTNDASFPVSTTNGLTISRNVPVANLVIKMAPAGTSALNAAFLDGQDSGGENLPSYVTTDGSGDVYTSFQNSNNGLPLVNPVQTAENGHDLQIVEQSSDLSTIKFSTYAGGSSSVTPAGIGLDAERNIYVAGEIPYEGADFTTTTGAYQATYPGGEQKGVVEKIGGIYPATSTTVTVSPLSIYFNTQVTVTAKVTSSSGTPAGDVAFYVDGSYVGEAALSNGSATLNFPAGGASVGSHTLEAIYLGSTTLGGSLASLSGSVAAIPTSTTLKVNPTTVAAGGNVTLTATVARTEGGGLATGPVEFLADGAVVASATLSNGVATVTVSTSGVAAGTYQVTAEYLGDAGDAGSTSSPAVNVTVQ